MELSFRGSDFAGSTHSIARSPASSRPSRATRLQSCPVLSCPGWQAIGIHGARDSREACLEAHTPYSHHVPQTYSLLFSSPAARARPHASRPRRNARAQSYSYLLAAGRVGQAMPSCQHECAPRHATPDSESCRLPPNNHLPRLPCWGPFGAGRKTRTISCETRIIWALELNRGRSFDSGSECAFSCRYASLRPEARTCLHVRLLFSAEHSWSQSELQDTGY
ncbi:hypothetical protein C8Q74DRAFT_273773 [Fomes fomentarius]|nr:hypothetical protein C8Q74DRAFT_273773 [Fomes fomentarius]